MQSVVRIYFIVIEHSPIKGPQIPFLACRHFFNCANFSSVLLDFYLIDVVPAIVPVFMLAVHIHWILKTTV